MDGGNARRQQARILGIALWGALAVVLVLAWVHRDVRQLGLSVPSHRAVLHLRSLMVRWGAWAPVASVVLMVAHTFVPFPADLLLVANGAVFGFWGGLGVSLIGSILSACLAFGIARTLGRPLALRLVREDVARRMEDAMAREGWKVALLVRLVPILPFTVVNMTFGLTSMRWTTFLWTTAVGILPTNVVMVALGYGIGDARGVLPWAMAALAAGGSALLLLRRRAMSVGAPTGSDPLPPP